MRRFGQLSCPRFSGQRCKEVSGGFIDRLSARQTQYFHQLETLKSMAGIRRFRAPRPLVRSRAHTREFSARSWRRGEIEYRKRRQTFWWSTIGIRPGTRDQFREQLVWSQCLASLDLCHTSTDGSLRRHSCRALPSWIRKAWRHGGRQSGRVRRRLDDPSPPGLEADCRRLRRRLNGITDPPGEERPQPRVQPRARAHLQHGCPLALDKAGSCRPRGKSDKLRSIEV